MVLSEETRNFEKVITSVLKIGPKVLLWVFSASCKDYDPNETLREYLSKKGWTKKDIKDGFDAVTKKKLDTKSSGSHWDITILFQLIQKVCDGVADRNSPNWGDSTKMEGMIKIVKDIRNDTAHGEPALTLQRATDILALLEDTCVNLIEKSSQKFGVSSLMANQFADDVKVQLASIFNSRRTEREVIKNLEDHFKDIVVEGVEELKSLYTVWSKITPVFFLDGWDCEIEVDSIFTEMIVTPAGRRIEGEGKIECNDVLQLSHQNIILVEGQAGSGKSTLLKYYLSNWTNGSNLVKGLEDYDIIIYYECRNRLLNSLEDLINSLLSKSIAKYSMIDYIKCIFNLKVLFLLDGFDEINAKSYDLVGDIFELVHKPNIHVVVTSRPPNLNNFFKMKPSMAKVKHLRLDGIPNDLHEVFVERLHKQLSLHKEFNCMKQDDYDTAMLVQYIRKAPENVRKHFLFPLNLTLITFLWIRSPENVHRVTTVTTLYKEILDLVNEKLCERLKKNIQCATDSPNKILAACQMAYEELCERALLDLLNRKYAFSEDSLGIIKKFCSNISTEDGTMKIPHTEVVGAYMAVKNTWTSNTSLPHYSYPHLSFQEHMAAVAICQDIKVKGKDFEQIVRERNMSFKETFLDGLLKHLIGIMSCEGSEFLHIHGPILIGIVGNEASDRLSEEWWLTLVSESLNDDVIAKPCSNHIQTEKWNVRDENVSSALALLKHVSPSYFDLNILAHISHVSKLKELTHYLAGSESQVCLRLFYNYWHPYSQGVDDIIMEILEGRCKLLELTSHVKKATIAKLPNTLTKLQIVVNDEESITALHHLHSLTNLTTLVFHLTAGIPLNFLKPLPSLQNLEMTFSGITDDYVIWLINAIMRLQPSENSIRNMNICGSVTALSSSSHHTAGGDGLTKEGYIGLLNHLSKPLFGCLSVLPIRKALVYSSQFPEDTSSFATPAPSQPQSSIASPITNPFSALPKSTPFCRDGRSGGLIPSKPDNTNSRISLNGDISIWSPILTNEERVDIKDNHNRCVNFCKLMSGSPF